MANNSWMEIATSSTEDAVCRKVWTLVGIQQERCSLGGLQHCMKGVCYNKKTVTMTARRLFIFRLNMWKSSGVNQ